MRSRFVTASHRSSNVVSYPRESVTVRAGCPSRSSDDTVRVVAARLPSTSKSMFFLAFVRVPSCSGLVSSCS